MTPVESTADARFRGETTIAGSIVAKIAGLSARLVPGVHAVGDNGASPFGRIRHAVGAPDYTQGVRVDVGTTEVAADVSVIADLGPELQDLCDRVRHAVTSGIEDLVGMRVVEVNVEVADIHLPGSNEPKERG